MNHDKDLKNDETFDNIKSETITCPECRHDQKNNVKCSYCGIIFKNYTDSSNNKVDIQINTVASSQKPEPFLSRLFTAYEDEGHEVRRLVIGLAVAGAFAGLTWGEIFRPWKSGGLAPAALNIFLFGGWGLILSCCMLGLRNSGFFKKHMMLPASFICGGTCVLLLSLLDVATFPFAGISQFPASSNSGLVFFCGGLGSTFLLLRLNDVMQKKSFLDSQILVVLFLFVAIYMAYNKIVFPEKEKLLAQVILTPRFGFFSLSVFAGIVIMMKLSARFAIVNQIFICFFLIIVGYTACNRYIDSSFQDIFHDLKKTGTKFDNDPKKRITQDKTLPSALPVKTVESRKNRSRYRVKSVKISPNIRFEKHGRTKIDVRGKGYSDRMEVIAADHFGRILIAGYSIPGTANAVINPDFTVGCFNPDGRPNMNFGIQGMVSFHSGHVDSMAFTNNNKIVIGLDTVLCRLKKNGSIDKTFGKGGFQKTVFSYNSIDDLTIDKWDRIVGTEITGGLFRYLPGGEMDFHIKIFEEFEKIYRCYSENRDIKAVAVDGMGNIIVGGSCNEKFFIAKFKDNGKPEKNFGKGGFEIFDVSMDKKGIIDMAVNKEGKIIAVGNGPAIICIMPDGKLDLYFGKSGKLASDSGLMIPVKNVTVQNDGKFVVSGGDSSLGFIFLTRLHPDGSLDNSFGDSGVDLRWEEALHSIAGHAVLNDGRVISGSTINAKGAANPDGKSKTEAKSNKNKNLDFQIICHDSDG